MTFFKGKIKTLPLATPRVPSPPPPVRLVTNPAIQMRADKAVFFKGLFILDRTADTYFDVSGYKKGVVWVNGHNLGRYWYVGPQQHLYCPASWLKKGTNEIVLLDLLQDTPAPVKGVPTLE